MKPHMTATGFRTPCYWLCAVVASVDVGLSPGVGWGDTRLAGSGMPRVELQRRRCSDTSSLVDGGDVPVSFSNRLAASGFGLSSSILSAEMNELLQTHNASREWRVHPVRSRFLGSQGMTNELATCPAHVRTQLLL